MKNNRVECVYVEDEIEGVGGALNRNVRIHRWWWRV